MDMTISVVKDNLVSFLKNRKYPHRMEDARACLLCTQGSVAFDFNLNSYELKANEFLNITPNAIVQLTAISDDFQGTMLLWPKLDLQDMDMIRKMMPYLKTILENPVLSMKEEDVQLIEKYMDLIECVNQKESSDAIDTFRYLMMSMSCELLRLYRRNAVPKAVNKSRTLQIFRDLCQSVMDNYKEHKEVSFYADQLCITPKHLTTTIKSLTNKTVSDIIASAVILDAKTQLKSTSDTVQQISNNLNFPNPSFFGKYFKKHTGMSPNKYRTQE
ncbi:MAG: helix-turn-helix domain-containing protein [Paludibacteraceae bacterium]